MKRWSERTNCSALANRAFGDVPRGPELFQGCVLFCGTSAYVCVHACLSEFSPLGLNNNPDISPHKEKKKKTLDMCLCVRVTVC